MAMMRIDILRAALLASVTAMPGVMLSGMMLTGCKSGPNPQAQQQTQRTAIPAVQPELAVPDTLPDESTATNTDEPSILPGGEAYLVDAMVGQVNGVPIYASDVLNYLDPQLSAMAEDLDGRPFIDQTRDTIFTMVEALVFNRLALDEARRDLADQELAYLDHLTQEHEAELIRRLGSGSQVVAEQRLRDEMGMTMQQALNDYREQQILGRYRYRRLIPMVDVTRRDIRRYYNDHPERYNPAAQWRVRFIRVADEGVANQIAQRLEGGSSFEQLAGDRRVGNLANPEEAGLWGSPVGENAFRNADVNEAYATLQEEAWAGPFREEQGGRVQFVFVQVVERIGGDPVPLVVAQEEIAQILQNEQMTRLTGVWRAELFRDGTYTPLAEMTDDLVSIAVARYKPELANGAPTALRP